MSSFDSMRMTNAWNVSVIPILLLYPFIGIKKKKRKFLKVMNICHRVIRIRLRRGGREREERIGEVGERSRERCRRMFWVNSFRRGRRKG